VGGAIDQPMEHCGDGPCGQPELAKARSQVRSAAARRCQEAGVRGGVDVELGVQGSWKRAARVPGFREGEAQRVVRRWESSVGEMLRPGDGGEVDGERVVQQRSAGLLRGERDQVAQLVDVQKAPSPASEVDEATESMLADGVLQRLTRVERRPMHGRKPLDPAARKSFLHVQVVADEQDAIGTGGVKPVHQIADRSLSCLADDAFPGACSCCPVHDDRGRIAHR